MKAIFLIFFTFHFAAGGLLLPLQAQETTWQRVYNGAEKENINFRKAPYKNENILPPVFTWIPIQTPCFFYFSDIFFIDSLYGWATHNGLGVIRTTDSGFNWDTVTFGQPNYMGGVHFVNRSTGWIVGGMGRIRKTINGGLNWVVQDTGIYTGWYNKVHFFDENTGIVIGEKNGPWGYIIKTTNGGDNWEEMYLSTIFNTTFENQYWFNADTGWICGYNILLKTTNGGSSFLNYYSNIPPTQNGYNVLLGITFVNQNTGWLAAGNIDRKSIYKTTNGGLNWFFQDNPISQYEYNSASDVKFLSPDSGWAAIYYLGVILFTSNGGTNWVIDYMNNYEFTYFSIYKKSKIWCAGSDGIVWYAYIVNPNGVINNNVPVALNLYQNYPNPFNPKTTIKYDIPHNSFVTFRVYDVLGKEVYSSSEFKLAGSYEIAFDGSNYATGLYFYRIEANSFVDTKKMLMIK